MKGALYKSRFLSLLGCTEKSPSLEYLRELSSAYENKVPYENYSKIVSFLDGQTFMPTPDEFLEAVETQGHGGTCFSVNYNFHLLLTGLGFDSQIVACETNGEQRKHMSLRVAIEGENYSLDFGLLSPSPGPFLLTGPKILMNQGERQIQFIPEGDGQCHRYYVIKDGVIRRSFITQPGRAGIDDFSEAITETYRPGEFFMTVFCVSRGRGERRKAVWNKEYWSHHGEKAQKANVTSFENLKHILNNELDLHCPRLPEVIEFLEKSNEPWFS